MVAAHALRLGFRWALHGASCPADMDVPGWKLPVLAVKLAKWRTAPTARMWLQMQTDYDVL